MRDGHAKLFWIIALLSTLGSFACSSDSASTPTTPSASAAGSVTTIKGTARRTGAAQNASALGPLAASTIRICVSGTTACADVSGVGDFELKGNFSGDVRLQTTGSQGTMTLTIPHVQHGETIVVAVDLNGTTGSMQIVSRSGGDGDDGEDKNDDDDDHDDGDIELRGTVSSLNGTCPAVNFVLNGTTIETSRATKFEDSCGAIQNGRRVEVSGTKQSNGHVAAAEVELD